MDEFRDRVAVITGGAAGIGRAMARAFAARGAQLVLADIDEPALAATEKELTEGGASVLAVPTDVRDRESVAALADEAWRHFGRVHLVCNNAGIATLGPLAAASPTSWEVTTAINYWGVVYGVQVFVPRLLEQAEGGHVLNTASMAGLVGMHGLGVYCATKFAVVGLSEALQRELEPHGIGVSVLCPMVVATEIGRNSRRLLGEPAFGAPPSGPAQPDPVPGGIISAEEVATRVVRGIERKALYIFTHPAQREILRHRAARQDAVFDEDF